MTRVLSACRRAAFGLTTVLSPFAAFAQVPQFDHVVIVVMENHSFSQIIGSANAPYINSLASENASFTQSFAIEHPSQPNYLDLFSGSNQGVTDDSCPHTFGTDNLGSGLIAAGFTFVGYSEELPAEGSTVCSAGTTPNTYQRKHNPWVNFTNVPAGSNQPYSAFPGDFSTLPTLSFVIPNQCHDMHDCSVATGDAWLQANIDAYAQWSKTHNSLLVLTWDENDRSVPNQIATIFVGALVVPGQYSETIDHFNVLATLEAMYALTPVGTDTAKAATPITDVWDQTIFADGFE
ncbi:MAG TPA: alkaline phosphatase family protein [Rudaea sp.]|nr:alkaline phosphatase family protein [Rudaea sp.]